MSRKAAGIGWLVLAVVLLALGWLAYTADPDTLLTCEPYGSPYRPAVCGYLPLETGSPTPWVR